MVTTFAAVCVVRLVNTSLPRIWKCQINVTKQWLQELKYHGIGKLLSPFVIHIGCEQIMGIITVTDILQ